MVVWTMRFVEFAILLSLCRASASNWQLNTDVMDLAIGIHYGPLYSGKGNVSALISVIKKMAGNLNFTQGLTRMAILDCGSGPEPVVKLAIEDGVNVKKVQDVADKIGQTEYKRPILFQECASQMHKFAFEKNGRVEVPKIAVIFALFDKAAIDKKDPVVKKTGEDVMLKHSVHMAFMSNFDGDNNTKFSCAFGHLCIKQSTSASVCKFDFLSDKRSLVAATTVLKGIRDSLKSCAFKKKSLSECYGKSPPCNKNVSYELAYRDSKGSTNPQRWREVEHYCFKNVSVQTCDCSENCDESFGTWSPCNATCANPVGVQIWKHNFTSSTCLRKSKNCTMVCTTTTTSTTSTPGPTSTLKPISTPESTATPEPTSIVSTKESTPVSQDTEGTSTIGDFKTTSSIGEESDENVYYDDDPLVIGLQRAIIALGVLLAVFAVFDIVVLVYAWKLRKTKTTSEPLKKGQTSLESKDSVSKGEWSIFKPPSLTMTPTADLMAKYSARGKVKGGKSKSESTSKSKSEKQAKSNSKSVKQQAKKG